MIKIRVTQSRDNHFIIDGMDLTNCVAGFNIDSDASVPHVSVDLSIRDFEFESDNAILKINCVIMPENLKQQLRNVLNNEK